MGKEIFSPYIDRVSSSDENLYIKNLRSILKEGIYILYFELKDEEKVIKRNFTFYVRWFSILTLKYFIHYIKPYEKDDIYFMRLVLKEAKKAEKIGEIPIGAIVVKDGKVISRSFNKVEKKNSSLMHAEIDALLKAQKEIKKLAS